MPPEIDITALFSTSSAGHAVLDTLRCNRDPLLDVLPTTIKLAACEAIAVASEPSACTAACSRCWQSRARGRVRP